ncbi:MAG: DUF370 domain-containing protein [Ruminococcaceae bacterium]|nr:DUF370 domain-containing protein [Oscillospiraceae bacterium]
MYLHIGDNVSIKSSQIIGFFDIDKTTTTKETRNFLSNSEQKGASVTISEDMPKSFIVTADKKGEENSKVYISPISVSTLKKRSKKGF